MKTEHIIIAILLIIILFLIWNNNKEHFLTGNEAVFNISRVYADASGTVNFNNIRTAGNASFNNTANFKNIFTTGNVDISGGKLDISGNLTVHGTSNFKGTAEKGGTHFPWIDDRNYIRGLSTTIDTPTVINGTIQLNGPTQVNGTTVHNGYVKNLFGSEGAIYSDGGDYKLVMQNDGNLVITKKDGTVTWDSK